MNDTAKKKALITTHNKQGLVELAEQLIQAGYTLLSTGGTAKHLRDHNIPLQEVADYTNSPELMEGRVKTLHPKIHAGLLGRPGIDEQEMLVHGIAPIDVLVINLYPFSSVVAREQHTLEEAIAHIDIGGPTLLRSAAKNYRRVSVVVSPDDYTTFAQQLKQENGLSLEQRFHYAQQAFAHVAAYDAAIANYLTRYENEETVKFFPKALTTSFEKKLDLRYGENPHQRAAFYADTQNQQCTAAKAEQCQGKVLSFNNLVDADTALECVKQFPCDKNVCVVVKHANPCGVASGKTLQESYVRAYQTDPQSAFGGIIAFNQPLDAETAATIAEQQFVEIVIAPQISAKAKEAFANKSNVRLLSSGVWDPSLAQGLDMRPINGGVLVQETDLATVNAKDVEIVTTLAPNEQQFSDLLFVFQVAKFVKSNAIVYGKEGQTLGIGAGQTSRVSSAEIGIIKAEAAGHSLRNCVMASDAFFPFRDAIDQAAAAGVAAIIQPGGSIRDAEVIAAANEHNIAMIFTGVRHFRH